MDLGQFIQLQTPEYELTDEPVYRAYSVSSPPRVTNRVEVEARRDPNGICTPLTAKEVNTIGGIVRF